MTRTAVDETFNHVIKTIGERLKPLGFARRGSVLRVAGEDTCGIVSFQRSVTNTRDKLLFTVNLGVVSGDLLDTGPSGLEKAEVWDAHVRERIGFLLPEHSDKWWEITAASDPEALAEEMSDLILKYVVPYVQHYLSADSIISLWESGQSPGLTSKQRVELLVALKAKRHGETRGTSDSIVAPSE